MSTPTAVVLQFSPAPGTESTRLAKMRANMRATAGKQCIAAIGFFLALVLLLGVAAPAMLRYGYPAIAFLVAVFLFSRSRTHYIGFVFWLWFVSPLVRRLVDYRAGFVPTNPLLLATFFATAVSGYVLVTRLHSLSRADTLPFSCALAGIFFGAVIGLTRYPALAVAQALLNWITPVLFAFFLYDERQRYREFQRVMERCLVYGMLVVGAYGVYQFFFLPVWDRAWMIDLGAQTFGVPEALQIRVFSTLNAPATCAAYLMAGLLLLFALKGKLRFWAAAAAFVALVLTSSRSSWVGLCAGIAYLVLQLPGKARLHAIAAVLASVVVLGIVTQLPVIDDVVSQRIQSFTDPKNDVSFNERADGHVAAFRDMLAEPMGEGMGSVDTDHTTAGADATIGPHDSTILELLYALGFPGTLLYLAGIAMAVAHIVRQKNRRNGRPDIDRFAVSMCAIVIALLVQLALNSIFVGPLGFLTWTAIAMTLAAGSLPGNLASSAG